MRLALAIAVGIHATLFAVSALVDIGQRIHLDLAVPSRAPIEIVVPSRAPIEIEYLDAPSTTVLLTPTPSPTPIPTETPTSMSKSSAHIGRAHIASNSAASAASSSISATTSSISATTSSISATSSSISSSETSRTEPGPRDNAPNPYLRMRGPELGLAGESAERIVGATQHDLPAETRKSGKVENAPNGEAIIHDRVTTMSIERDGHAHFKDKKDIDLKLKLPIPHIDVEGMRKDLGELITDWYADPYASTKFGRTSDLPNHLIAAPGACDEWGSIWCDDPLAPGAEKRAREQGKAGGTAGVGGPADITAYLHRKYIGDPYASRKLKLLDDTRDERVDRGAAFRDQQLVRSAELIERNIARATQLAGRERRVALFELWDECSEGDDAEGHAGQRARAQVIGWIRAHLPKGSADAFTDDEIAELAARRTSHQPFEPY